MKGFGIPTGRLNLYAGIAVLLVGANVAQFVWDRSAPSGPAAQTNQDLPELPALAVAIDFDSVVAPPTRNLFIADAPAPVAIAPPPEPEPKAEPAPDPHDRIRADVNRTLDSIGVIGFLSTGEGIVAVLNMGGSVVNALKGDKPVPGYIVSEITTNSVTLTHVELGIKRTYGLNNVD